MDTPEVPEVPAALCRGTDRPPCPVVVITGTAGQDGLRLLGAGAQDDISKRRTSADSLTRAVENAIERFALLTERRRVHDALRTSEQHCRALFNSIDSGFAILQVIFDVHGMAADARYRQVNPAFARQPGRPTPRAGRSVTWCPASSRCRSRPMGRWP
jgi:PAS domain-containing protein